MLVTAPDQSGPCCACLHALDKTQSDCRRQVNNTVKFQGGAAPLHKTLLQCCTHITAPGLCRAQAMSRDGATGAKDASQAQEEIHDLHTLLHSQHAEHVEVVNQYDAAFEIAEDEMRAQVQSPPCNACILHAPRRRMRRGVVLASSALHESAAMWQLAHARRMLTACGLLTRGVAEPSSGPCT